MRPAVRAIYHFARTADDLADEGDDTAGERRAALQHFREALTAAAQGQPMAEAWPGVFGPLAQVMHQHALPLPCLMDLLDAFEQDTYNRPYETRDQLLAYCRRSANPVGRLMLHLAGVRDAQALALSDQICTALQLINFWQDASVDLPRGRVYFPRADAHAHGLSLAALQRGEDSPATQAMLRDLCEWAADFMQRGAPLARKVPGRLGWELRLVVQGGARILERIEAMHFRTLSQRPKLGASDLPLLLWRAWRMPAA